MDMKSNVGNSKNSFEGESSYLSKLQSEAKHQIFRVIQRMLKDEE
jgi:hypothetical protein